MSEAYALFAKLFRGVHDEDALAELFYNPPDKGFAFSDADGNRVEVIHVRDRRLHDFLGVHGQVEYVLDKGRGTISISKSGRYYHIEIALNFD